MATVTKPIALDESLNTTETPPRNVADVLAEELSAIASAIGGGGSGGHTIENSSGTDMTARTHLQFKGADVTDDPTNDRTLVTVPTYSDATQSADGLMSAADKTKLDGIHTGADAVSWTQIQQSGTKIAEVDINGTSTDVYAPMGGGGGVTDVEVNGTSVVSGGVASVTVPTALSDLSEDTTHRVVTDTEKSTWSGKVSDNPTFTEASTRANIASGESFATILGKIKKWFTDIPNVFVSKTENSVITGRVDIDRQNGTTESVGDSNLWLGNSTPVGTQGNSRGGLCLYSSGSKYTVLRSLADGANRTVSLPNKDGTVALEGNIFKRTTWDGSSGSGITFSNVTYMSGGYIHIGNLVHFEYRMAVTSPLTANVDYRLINGLPAQFSSANVTAFGARCGRSLLNAYMVASDSTIQCTPTYNVPVNSFIVISGTYFTSTYKI